MSDDLAILWTGGWDSTYAVLDGVLVRGRTVAPHYIADPNRPSMPTERAAMERIRAALAAHDPAAAERLRPLTVRALGDIAIDPEDQRRYADLSTRRRVAPQNLWLASYARTVDLPLGVGLVRCRGGLSEVMHADFVEVDGLRRLRADPTDPGFELFRRFAFPTILLDKRAMHDRAREAGFAALLELSWFCHRPRRDGSVCGMCIPCHDARTQGMAWRLPRGARVRGALLDATPGDRAKRHVRRWLRRWAP